jgi:hypothetical protein
MLATSQPPLSAQQVGHVLELMELKHLAPKEALRQLDVLTKLGEFSVAQGFAIQVLLTLEHDEMARVLRESCADDDALELERTEPPHEARLT